MDSLVPARLVLCAGGVFAARQDAPVLGPPPDAVVALGTLPYVLALPGWTVITTDLTREQL